MRHSIEAVTVCVNYADFLAETAAVNRPHLSRWVIVTTPGDKATQAVARKYGLETILSDDTSRNGPFDKGRLIDRGLAVTRGDGWLLHLDADIALPTDLDAVLEDAHLDPACIYGCDRLNVRGAAVWDGVRRAGLLSRGGPWMVGMTRPGCTVGARVANVRHGYAPPGFFQLWHGSKPGVVYPAHHGTAARTDIAHTYQWDRRHRVLIPELLVWHLESGDAKMGANWKGRKTLPFRAAGSLVPTEAFDKEAY